MQKPHHHKWPKIHTQEVTWQPRTSPPMYPLYLYSSRDARGTALTHPDVSVKEGSVLPGAHSSLNIPVTPAKLFKASGSARSRSGVRCGSMRSVCLMSWWVLVQMAAVRAGSGPSRGCWCEQHLMQSLDRGQADLHLLDSHPAGYAVNNCWHLGTREQPNSWLQTGHISTANPHQHGAPFAARAAFSSLTREMLPTNRAHHGQVPQGVCSYLVSGTSAVKSLPV